MPRERPRPDVGDPPRPTPDRALRLRIEVRTSGSGALCRQLLEELPDWFGIPEAIDEYVVKAERATAVVAIADRREVGLLTLVRHTAFAAEIDVMAVRPDYHRRGVGRAIVDRAERLLVLDGVEYLQVKTLADTVEYEPYASTRAFYVACGFRPMQVFPDLWDPENPALQLVKRLPSSHAAAG
ncbi:MAG: GNAT family N-acetyltransferase [Solirubrobacteraceae bacterium]